MSDIDLVFFGDLFLHPGNGELSVVVAYFNNRDWWYVEKNSSVVKRASFFPSDCKWVTKEGGI